MKRKLFRILLVPLCYRGNISLTQTLSSSLAGLVGCFMLAIAASAQTSYTHTPGITDIVTNGGNPKTLVVQIANLTQYNMDLTGYSPTLQDQTDRSRHTTKSFMFAPLGLPSSIPPLAGDPTNAKPYTMVLSWDDNAGYATNNWLTYTLRGVDCTDPTACVVCTDPTHCTTITKEDVDIGLWITRTNPGKALTANFYYQLAKNTLQEVFAIVGVIVLPEKPSSWTHFVLGTADLTKDLVEFDGEQNAAGLGHQWYVASFPVPSNKYQCYLDPECYPSLDVADDAIEENWGPGLGGPTQSRVVVITQLDRGKAPQKSVNTDCNIYASWGSLGAVPTALVTITTLDIWDPAVTAALARCTNVDPVPDYCPNYQAPSSTLASLGRRPPGQSHSSSVSESAPMIRSILQEHGRDGLLALVSVVRGLNPNERDLLHKMFQTWNSGDSFSPREEALLHLIAIRLRKEMR